MNYSMIVAIGQDESLRQENLLDCENMWIHAQAQNG